MRHVRYDCNISLPLSCFPHETGLVVDLCRHQPCMYGQPLLEESSRWCKTGVRRDIWFKTGEQL